MAYPHLHEHARTILHTLAQQIAREYELDYVGTEHILLALLRHDDGTAAAVLKGLGLTEAKAKAALDELLKRQMEDTWVFGRLPGSPSYRNVMAHAIDEAAQLESETINSEHLLLALLREKDSTAAQILARFGATLAGVRQAVVDHPAHS